MISQGLEILYVLFKFSMYILFQIIIFHEEKHFKVSDQTAVVYLIHRHWSGCCNLPIKDVSPNSGHLLYM